MPFAARYMLLVRIQGLLLLFISGMTAAPAATWAQSRRVRNNTVYPVAILGASSAGLLAARHLCRQLAQVTGRGPAIALIGDRHGGSSSLSGWFVAQKKPAELERELMAGLGTFHNPERVALLSYLAHNHH